MSKVVELSTRRDRSSREAADRRKISKKKIHVLEAYGVTGDMTGPQVCDLFGISRSGLLAICRKFGEELKSVGYVPAGQSGGPSMFTPRAVLHVAMILRPGNSNVARKIKVELGLIRDIADTPPTRQEVAAHVSSCSRIVDRAVDVILAVRDEDSLDVWDSMRKLDEWQLKAIIVALATMVPIETGTGKLFGFLNELVDGDDPTPGRGLSKMLPTRRQNAMVADA